MRDSESLLVKLGQLIRGASLLGWPRAATEQYPKGLGPTVSVLKQEPGLQTATSWFEKTAFSCLGAEGFSAWAQAGGRVVLAGIETHVCVAQTARDLLRLGCHVDLVADAVRSRNEEDRHWALLGLAAEGVRIVTTEMILFESLGNAKDPRFKELSKIIK